MSRYVVKLRKDVIPIILFFVCLKYVSEMRYYGSEAALSLYSLFILSPRGRGLR